MIEKDFIMLYMEYYEKLHSPNSVLLLKEKERLLTNKIRTCQAGGKFNADNSIIFIGIAIVIFCFLLYKLILGLSCSTKGCKLIQCLHV